MKVSCPNCKRVLQAPDDWAGRTVKCPSCKKPITLPQSDAHHDLGFDLGSLDAIEDAGQAVVSDRKAKPMKLKDAMAASVSQQQTQPPVASDPAVRVCPKCAQKVRSDDIYSDLICRHCGAGIPGREVNDLDQARYTSSMAGRMTSKVSFYTGFSSAALYPIPGFPSILIGAGVALGAIAVPLLATLAFTESASLNPVNERTSGGDSAGWVGYFLTVMFTIEAIYFGAVGYYILIDTIRSTASGNEQPPGLTWNVINLGAALGGYAALLAFYAIVVLLVFGGMPDAQRLADPWRLLVIALLTFGVPMNMIGLASSHALDGLNPVRVFRSIGRLIGHYIFLFLIALLYLCIYFALMYGIMSWAGPVIMETAQKGLKVGFFRMLGGIAAWAMLIALGFYFAYSIGRILGLFTRSYREEIDFEL